MVVVAVEREFLWGNRKWSVSYFSWLHVCIHLLKSKTVLKEWMFDCLYNIVYY